MEDYKTEETAGNHPYIEKAYYGNMPCDTTGFCAGANCKYFLECKENS